MISVFFREFRRAFREKHRHHRHADGAIGEGALIEHVESTGRCS
jgi:hypothetical protein